MIDDNDGNKYMKYSTYGPWEVVFLESGYHHTNKRYH